MNIFIDIILILLSLISLTVLFWKIISRKRHPKEAPVVSGWIPWMGVGIEFGKDPVAFLEKAHRQTQSQVISCRMAGQNMHFLLNQSDLSVITKNHKLLEFDTFTHDILVKGFGMNPTTVPLLPSTVPDMHKLLATYLRGPELEELNIRFSANFKEYLLAELTQINPHQPQNIFQFIVKLVFNAGGYVYYYYNYNY